MATYGPYAGTKFALEAVSDSLRREIAPLGVQVVVVEPGAVRTEMPARAIATAHQAASARPRRANWAALGSMFSRVCGVTATPTQSAGRASSR